jgi:hypothetical protein
MKRVVDLSAAEARAHFLKGSSYFNGDLPSYLSFEPIIAKVSGVLGSQDFAAFKANSPSDFAGVNYSFITNKDGRLAWRPYELMHPALYVSLVNAMCDADAWASIQKRFSEFSVGAVECCSHPVLSLDHQTDVATQVKSWWQKVEQRSLVYSLEYSHLLHTDVTDCYGSLYTHSISWALHGMEEAKKNKHKKAWLGNRIDTHIQAGRFGQTNGISQGSVLMDFLAELVLGYVDNLITSELGAGGDVRILRYRDDYRIFANDDESSERALKIISDKLRAVGMRLGTAKTITSRNVIEGSIKPDKLAGIGLQDLGIANAKSLQKQLLRLHAFSQRYPNSGALRRLVSEYHSTISMITEAPDDIEVQVAIATDIAFVSPSTFPAVAGILSHLISLSSGKRKADLWSRVHRKMATVPYNGYLEIWLQRVTKPKSVGIQFESEERICQIVNGHKPELWESSWIASHDLKATLDVSQMIVADAGEVSETIQPEEVELFAQSAWEY